MCLHFHTPYALLSVNRWILQLYAYSHYVDVHNVSLSLVEKTMKGPIWKNSQDTSTIWGHNKILTFTSKEINIIGVETELEQGILLLKMHRKIMVLG